MKKWKTLSSTMAFDHKWLKVRQDVVELPNGMILDDYFVWLPGDVSVVVPVTKDNQFVLVKQYKHAADELMIEYPAGFINKDETPLAAAKRELAEETGYTAAKITKIGTTINDPTKGVGVIHLFLAEDVQQTQAVAFDETEELETLVKPYKEVFAMIQRGEIWASGSVAATLLVFDRLQLLTIKD